MSFGVIFHWGLYSVPCYDDVKSARRRRTKNGSEWYLKRLLEDNTFRPTSGYQSTQKIHKELYCDSNDKKEKYNSYMNFKDSLHIEDMDHWMKLCKNAGAEYVILTAKHHDGFCLFPTKTTEHYTRDFVQMFKDTAQNYGLTFGLYYSWTEFNVSCTKDYINNVMIPQIKELRKYKPKIWWFDGDWNCKSHFSKAAISDIVKKLRKTALVNDRLAEKLEDNELGLSSYRVYADRFVPKKKSEVPFESIHSIGLSWGNNKEQEEKDYTSSKELYRLYKKVLKRGGKFLLNLGPDQYGVLDPTEERIFRELGCLINKEVEVQFDDE